MIKYATYCFVITLHRYVCVNIRYTHIIIPITDEETGKRRYVICLDSHMS